MRVKYARYDNTEKHDSNIPAMPENSPSGSENAEDMKIIKRNKRVSLIKLVAIALSVIFAVFVSTFSWFTMSRENETKSVQMAAVGQNFELSSVTNNNPQDTKYNDFYNVVAADTNSNAIVWKMTSQSSIGNYTGQEGIEPGSRGKISFVLTPKTTPLNLKFEFQIIRYKSGGTLAAPTMTEIPDGYGKNNINGHILFFENYSEGKYSGLIASDADMNRVFTKSFNGGAEQVDIYWVWPEYLNRIVEISGSSSNMLVNTKTAAEPVTYTDDYTELISNISSYPQYYFKGNVSDSSLSALLNRSVGQIETTIYSDISAYNNLYDEADTAIGTGVDYILIRMEVTEEGAS